MKQEIKTGTEARAKFAASLGIIGNGARVSSVTFAKTPQERELLAKMKQSKSAPLNKTVHSLRHLGFLSNSK